MDDLKEAKKQGVSRRDFFKIGAMVGTGLQVAGVAGAGYMAGKSYESYTSWRDFEGQQQVDRKGWEVDGPLYKPVSETRRPDKNTDYIFDRTGILGHAFMEGWRPDKGYEVLGEPLASFYKEHPEDYKLDIKRFTEVLPTAAKDKQKYGDYFALAEAYSEGWADVFTAYPPEPTKPPEKSDFEYVLFGLHGPETHKLRDPMPLKSENHASELIKKMAHLYGSTIVRITRLNPDFCYSNNVRGGKPGPYDVPKHWKYAIVVGVPHEWDQVLSNSAHGTSYDGYNRVRNCAGRLTNFIKHLGYPARSHHPPDKYDLLVPPVSVDAGMGELGRHGFVITPETGSNLRTAVVTTNFPMKVDKPIKFGVAEFCESCKICAESCPSGAISMADSPKGMVLRGREHWHIHSSKCFNYWLQAMGPLGCRLCLAVCPYSRKGNYAHKFSKFVHRNDPTGMAKDVLVWMQKTMFKGPKAQEYLRPPDGRFAGYREAPPWLQVENWFDMKVNNPQKGG